MVCPIMVCDHNYNLVTVELSLFRKTIDCVRRAALGSYNAIDVRCPVVGSSLRLTRWPRTRSRTLFLIRHVRWTVSGVMNMSYEPSRSFLGRLADAAHYRDFATVCAM